jgi:hypothetical protein
MSEAFPYRKVKARAANTALRGHSGTLAQARLLTSGTDEFDVRNTGAGECAPLSSVQTRSR